MQARVALLGAMLAGCGGDAAPKPPAPTPAEASTPSAAAPTPSSAPAAPQAGLAVEPGDDGPPVLLVPKGLSPLYENFFKDPEALTALSKRLGTTLNHEQTVTVEVTWSEEQLADTLLLLVPDGDAVAQPVARSVREGGAVDPSAIQPLVASMGAWRADLGSRFDLRLLSFETRVVFWDQDSGSRCWMTGPANDPDGTALNACFTCLVPGQGEEQLCRQGERWPAELSGSKRARSMLASALTPAD